MGRRDLRTIRTAPLPVVLLIGAALTTSVLGLAWAGRPILDARAGRWDVLAVAAAGLLVAAIFSMSEVARAYNHTVGAVRQLR